MSRILNSMLLGAIVLVSMASSGCRDLTQQLPNGTVDPAAYRTREGAVKLYHGVKLVFHVARFAEATGLFTDELHSGTRDVSSIFGRVPNELNARDAASRESSEIYELLHRARNHIVQAIAMFSLFPDDSLNHYRGELFALHGFVLTYFAEAFCSGIPLSHVDFDSDFTYAPGISRDSVLRVALAQYDSAAMYAGEDSLVGQMIAAGRARVWLQRDSVRVAATYAAQVRPGFQYTLPSLPSVGERPMYHISDREGSNGLPYRSNGDPRTAVTVAQISTTNGISDTLFYLQKIGTARTPVLLMSAVEAALIVAEKALVAGEPDWLEHLNALRTNGTFTVTGTDTVWNAGTGGVRGLRPLSDPGLENLPPGKTVFDVRLDRVMQERAYWLFLNGTRLGDLRRLVRYYGRDAEAVYPTGPYGYNGSLFNVRYGTDVVFPVPQEEQELNLLYRGCFNLEA